MYMYFSFSVNTIIIPFATVFGNKLISVYLVGLFPTLPTSLFPTSSGGVQAAGRAAARSVGRSGGQAGELVGRSVGRSVGLSVCRSVGQSVGRRPQHADNFHMQQGKDYPVAV